MEAMNGPRAPTMIDPVQALTIIDFPVSLGLMSQAGVFLSANSKSTVFDTFASLWKSMPPGRGKLASERFTLIPPEIFLATGSCVRSLHTDPFTTIIAKPLAPIANRPVHIYFKPGVLDVETMPRLSMRLDAPHAPWILVPDPSGTFRLCSGNLWLTVGPSLQPDVTLDPDAAVTVWVLLMEHDMIGFMLAGPVSALQRFVDDPLRSPKRQATPLTPQLIDSFARHFAYIAAHGDLATGVIVVHPQYMTDLAITRHHPYLDLSDRIAQFDT
ncbi:hypothetical protein GGF31_007365 [Allomyces arbusculus]|nr:hypothetical protein GGF31_007365 [Allomyces arbusculus]